MFYKGLDVQDRRAKLQQDLELGKAKLTQDDIQDRRRIGLGYGQLKLGRDQLAEQQRYHTGALENDAARIEAERLKAGGGDISASLPEGVEATSPAFARDIAKGGEVREKALSKIALHRSNMDQLQKLEKLRELPYSPAIEEIYNQEVAKFVGRLAAAVGSGTVDQKEYARYVSTMPKYTSKHPDNSLRTGIRQGLQSPSALISGKDLAAEQFELMRGFALEDYGKVQNVYGFKDSYNPWASTETEAKPAVDPSAYGFVSEAQ
jgi:hypothetical protein